MPRVRPDLARGVLHGLGLGVVQGHRLLAEYVALGAQRSDGLRRVQKNRRCQVDGGGVARREGTFDIGPGGNAVGLGIGRVAGHDAGEFAARFGQDRGQNALAGDVADAGYQPGNH